MIFLLDKLLRAGALFCSRDSVYRLGQELAEERAACKSRMDEFSTILPFNRMRSLTLSEWEAILFKSPMIAPE